MADNLISTKERDYLDEDPELRGQKYVCLSFLSPEEVIRGKEAFACERFLSALSKDVVELFDGIRERFAADEDVKNMVSALCERYEYLVKPETLNDQYNFFVENNSEDIAKDYMQKNDFRTCMRGIKVRGTYETLPEAENRAKQIQKTDPTFNVYVAQVGCWCPWNPSPEGIAVEYAESELNTLMKKYKENQNAKDEIYELRKQGLLGSEIGIGASGSGVTTTEALPSVVIQDMA